MQHPRQISSKVYWSGSPIKCQIFPGVVLLTSHDHTFMQTVANRIIELTPNGMIDRLMSFDEYINDERVHNLREEMYR